ncbi:MAG: glycosyltransferase [Nitrospirae bacterium]|nr:glycosyltransferase [Nitrospirota bacterium]
MVYPDAAMAAVEMQALHDAHMEAVYRSAGDPREWARAMEQLGRESANRQGEGGSRLTPLERLYLYCHLEISTDPVRAASLQPVLRKYLDAWPDDFFLLYAETELSNLLGVDSPHRDRLVHAVVSDRTAPPVPFDHQLSRSSNPVLSVCVSTWNRVDSIRRLLDSVRLHTHVPFEILVVDNGSTDGTLPYLASMRNGFPELGVILSRGHRSTLDAYRLAFGLVRGSIIGALADDTEVTPGWAEALVAALQSDSRIGTAFPLVLESDGAVDRLGSCVPYSSRKHPWVGKHGPLPYRQGVPPDQANLPGGPFDSEGGAYPFLRRNVLARLNIFDPRYVHVWDNDLALESRSKGLRNVTCPGSRIIDHRVIHEGPRVDGAEVGGSFGLKLFHDPDSALAALRAPDSIVMRYFRDDLLLQCKWWAFRIRPCNRQASIEVKPL